MHIARNTRPLVLRIYIILASFVAAFLLWTVCRQLLFHVDTEKCLEKAGDSLISVSHTQTRVDLYHLLKNSGSLSEVHVGENIVDERLHNIHKHDVTAQTQNYARSNSSSVDIDLIRQIQSTQVETDMLYQNVRKCLLSLSLGELVHKDFEYAEHLLTEYRRVIPQQFLKEYSGHCWKAEYKIEVLLSVDSHRRIFGNIGNVTFNQTYFSDFELARLSEVTNRYPPFSSHVTCLPHVYLAGFMKCGTTFLDCFIKKLVTTTLFTASSVHAAKEPRFWIEPHLQGMNYTARIPLATDLGGYIANFAEGIYKVSLDISQFNASQFILMDSSPFYLTGWPTYGKDDDIMSNICLLPSTMPLLLPRAKYIVVMREPVSALYSSFWYSCSMYDPKLSSNNQLKGPDIFHERVMNEVNTFNECMTDKRVPHFSRPCCLQADCNYAECIFQRFHLLSRCLKLLNPRNYTIGRDYMPQCGDIRLQINIYYGHILKWLSVLPKERFLFLIIEEVDSNLENAAQSILHFLELPVYKRVKVMADRFARSCKQNKQGLFPYKKNDKLWMRNDTRSVLKTFLKPFNVKLAQLLGDLKFLTLW